MSKKWNELNIHQKMSVYDAEKLVQDYMNSDYWIRNIPAIPMKDGWMMQPSPNFSGSIARFRITTKKLGINKSVSIYFDAYDRLGCVGEPYWELYPVDGDAERYVIGEEEKLSDAIERALKQRASDE